MSEGQENASQPQTDAPQQTETSQGKPQIPTEISALRDYRAAREAQKTQASSAESTQSAGAGESRPNDAAQSQSPDAGREQYIPRDRFDQVNQQKNQYKQQLEYMQQMMQQPQQPAQPQQQPGFTGMVHQAPQPQQTAPQPELPDFNDPNVKKEWQRKLSKDPIAGIQELMDIAIQQRGTPLLERYVQQVQQQLQPIQQNFLRQQVDGYVSQRQSDPDFAPIEPMYRQMAAQAANLGYNISDPSVQQTVEFVARQQAQQQGMYNPQANQMVPQPAPFSERPGNAGMQHQASGPQLTPQQKAMAKRFGMTEERYAQSLEAMGVKPNG